MGSVLSISNGNYQTGSFPSKNIPVAFKILTEISDVFGFNGNKRGSFFFPLNSCPETGKMSPRSEAMAEARPVRKSPGNAKATFRAHI